MLQRVEKFENKLKDNLREYGKYMAGGLAVSILAYFMMMSLNLVNHLDGIWHLSNFIAGDWEISLGRGLQRYADRARFGIVSDSFNTVLTLLLISMANTSIIKRLPIDCRPYRIILLMLLSVNPVICESLTYSFTSVNFGLAYLFSVISFSCFSQANTPAAGSGWKQPLAKGSAAGLFLGISMAFYQAYIGVTCLLITLFLLKLLCGRSEPRRIARCIFSGFYTILCGGILYYAITQALLLRAGIPLAPYKGAANITPRLIITRLPQSVKQCYSEFFSFFTEAKALSRLEFIDVVLLGIAAYYLFALIIQAVRLARNSLASAMLFTALIILLPVACCFVLIIAVGNSMTGLMSMGLIMCPVLLGAVIPGPGRLGFYMKRLNILLLAGLAWFQLSAVTNDQLALKEGKTATVTLAENIIYQLSREGYLGAQQPVALVGRPANNDLFAQSTAFRLANEYAKFGCWSTDARNNRVSWEGIISNFLGVNVNLCGDTEYRELISLEQVADMPEFPSEGSICVIRDTVVVKVSDLY